MLQNPFGGHDIKLQLLRLSICDELDNLKTSEYSYWVYTAGR